MTSIMFAFTTLMLHLHMQLRIISIILIIISLLQPIRSVYVMMDYEINKGFISKYLCENKDKPALKCEGKCYLMKMLKKAADQEEQEKNNKIANIKGLELCEVPFIIQFKFKSYISESLDFLEAESLQTGNFDDVFHPPQQYC